MTIKYLYNIALTVIKIITLRKNGNFEIFSDR